MPSITLSTQTARVEYVRDARRWDAALLAHAEPSFLQSFAWGRQKQHFDWIPVRLLIPGSDAAAPAAQVLFRRLPGTPYTVGYSPRGPVMDYAHDGALDLMQGALARLARRYHAVAITWEPPVPDDPLLAQRLRLRGLRPVPGVQARTTRRIDLRQGLEAAAAQQHQKWRYNTRLARKHGVQVRAARTPDDLARWYTLVRLTAARDGFGVHEEAYYRRFWLENAGSGSTALLLAEHEGNLLAGVLVHQFGSEATYMYGASGNDARKLMPNHLLQWEAMRWAAARGAAAYDLFGVADSDDPGEPLAGVTRFKAGWGGEVVRYAGCFDSVYHPVLYRLLRRVRGLA